jgi:hypothetical protein
MPLFAINLLFLIYPLPTLIYTTTIILARLDRIHDHLQIWIQTDKYVHA